MNKLLQRCLAILLLLSNTLSYIFMTRYERNEYHNLINGLWEGEY
jgi:hypothetical protein